MVRPTIHVSIIQTHSHTLNKHSVVIMDELDQLVTKKQTVMYNFFNWPTRPRSNLIVIAIANTMDLPERMLSNKISSWLGECCILYDYICVCVCVCV